MTVKIIALSLLLTATPVFAHDFWVQPQRFQTEVGRPLPAIFLVGHATFRQRWNVGADHILLLNDIANGKKRDIRGDLRPVGGPADFFTKFDRPGIHVLAMQSTYAFSELPSIRFNDYARLEGLTPILTARQRAGTTDQPGLERYSRRAKALIQVGIPTPANSAQATRPVGLKLEIVPERNPYALGASRMLPVHVLYNGRRLPGATVMLTRLESDAKPVATAITDRNGRASFRVPSVDSWLVNVIWSEAVQGDSRFQFDTTFSSLTFGYAPENRRR